MDAAFQLKQDLHTLGSKLIFFKVGFLALLFFSKHTKKANMY